MLPFNRSSTLAALVAVGCLLLAKDADADGKVLNAEQIAFQLSQTKGIRLSDDASAGVVSSVNLPAVTFGLNSSSLTSTARMQLDELAKVLGFNRYAERPFMIAGHTDATGSADHNRALSEQRAMSTKNYLVGHHGIATTRIQTSGFGESQLLPTAGPDDGLQRRVEIRLLK